jgi:long-chain acyl-CoA synthetase
MEKIWLKNYQEGIAAEINPDTHASIVDLLEESLSRFSHYPAFRNFGRTLDYQHLHDYSLQFSSYLQNVLHLKKGDKVGIMLPNILQYPVVMMGILRAGLVVVNINPLYTPRELIHQVNDAQLDTLIVLANFAKTVQDSLPHMLVKNIIITEIGDLMLPIKRVVMNFAVRYIKRLVPAYDLPKAIKFLAALKQGEMHPLKSVKLTGDDIAFLQYTGGTTGVSKGAILTHRNIIANVEQVAEWIHLDIHEKHMIIMPLPLYHIFSLMVCLVFIKVGCLNLLITNPRDIGGFIDLLRKEKFHGVIGVNTLFNALMNHPDFSKIDFSSMILALGGGMAVQKAVADKWETLTHKPLLEGYGLTETSPVVCINPLNLKAYIGSIGYPVPSTEVKIVGTEGQELPLGEVGELYVRGPQVMKGYWNQVEETKKVLSDDGWLNTGDMARIDEKGLVYLVDRKKDLILVSGFNVYPNELEDVLMTCPGVKEAAVIGVPDEHSGEVPKAFIVKADPLLTEEAIREYCRANLTAYKRPKYIEFRTELPKSNVGKILRKELRG